MKNQTGSRNENELQTVIEEAAKMRSPFDCAALWQDYLTNNTPPMCGRRVTWKGEIRKT